MLDYTGLLTMVYYITNNRCSITPDKQHWYTTAPTTDTPILDYTGLTTLVYYLTNNQQPMFDYTELPILIYYSTNHRCSITPD